MTEHHHAIAIDNTHFFYLCPYDKKECSSLVHFHGSGNDSITNRTEGRSSHCCGSNPNGFHNVEVTIDKHTLRKTLAIRGNSITFKSIRKKT